MKNAKQSSGQKKFGSATRLAVLLLTALGILCACAGNSNNETTPPVGDGNYTVQVKTAAGQAVANVDVFAYTDATLADMVAVAKTDATGTATFAEPLAQGCVVTLKNVPKGYPVEDSYPLTDEITRIVLTAKLIEAPDLSKDTFGLNDVMFDFTVTDTENKQYTLSQLLQEKKAVVLNFWFANCDPCKAEFPFLQEAFLQYSDDIALLAVSPMDAAETVAQFRTAQGLTIPMASVDGEWEQAFGLEAYPTTIVIDRFGNINTIHAGTVPNTELFANMFKYYAADDYTQQTGLTLEDFSATADPGTEGNPLEFGGVMEFEVTAEPGQSVYCHVYKVSGMDLTVEDASVSITYNENTYLPENGVVTFPVNAPDTYTPVKLVFTNTGSEKKTYRVTLSYPAGTMGNPFELQIGGFTVDVPAGAEQGVYYMYTARENGELTVKCTGITGDADYTFTLYNLNTYVYKAYDVDGADNELTISVKAGDEVQFTAGALPDEENQYPAVKLQFVASFKKTTVQNPTVPTTPVVTEPQPTEPQPTEPQPTEPQPTEPQPTEPKELESTHLYVGDAYYVNVGNTTVPLTANKCTYFLFTPERSGQYRFVTNKGTLSYHGNNLSFIQDLTNTVMDDKTEQTAKSYVINIKEGNLGSSYLIGITAPAGTTEGQLEIVRVGDAVLGWQDMPYEVYNGVYTPKQYTFPGGTVKYVDVTGKAANFVPVLGSDGYYHLNSASGPLLYANLTSGAFPDLTLSAMLNSERPIIQGYVKDESGSILSKEQYNDLVQKYIDCSADGLYPLTADLMRILKTQNDSWYLYLAMDNSRVNKEITWMCNICYVP